MTHYTPFTHNFLESILSSIDSKDPVVANAWLDTLLDVVDLLPVEVLAVEVLAIAKNKANESQSAQQRIGSCQLVGKLGMKLDQQMVQDELVPLVRNLSHDKEWNVRASMCSHLVYVVRGLTKNGQSFESVEPVRAILSLLFELGEDETEAVRLVVVEASSTILQYLDEESVKTTVPWIQQISERALKVEDKTLPLLAQHWARISRIVQVYLNDSEKDWFTQFYYQLASLGSTHHVKDKPHMPDLVTDTDSGQKLEIYAEVRHACAANSAAMVPFIGAELFAQRIASMRALSVDPYFVVRRAVAANLLDLCRLADTLGKVIHPLFNQLLVDPCTDVTSALVPHIGAIIEHLARLGPLGPFVDEGTIVETFGAVLRCEDGCSSSASWRLQADMLSQLAAFPLCLPCNAVHDLLTPRLWHRIETMRPLPCRISAAQTLMLCVRSERRKQERSALCSAIISKLATASSCHGRMLFLRVCPILFDLLSRKFIRREFFLPLVRLAGDKVANVRLRFATLLPKLHISLRGLDVETEKRLIVELDSTVRWLVESEKDRDVKGELANFFRWVNDEQERSGRGDLEYQKRLQEEETVDRRKEEEERLVDAESPPVEGTVGSEPGRSAFFSSAPEAIDEKTCSAKPQQLPEQPSPQPAIDATERQAVGLDPSTDDFLRDAGVRLSQPSSLLTRPKTPVADSSRIPSIQSRLRPPSTTLVKTTPTALPHFGIARGVQQVQPQPSMAYGVTPVTSPVRVQRRPAGTGTPLNATKSRSQENLSSPIPRQKVVRPISTCLGTDDLLQATTAAPNKPQASAFARNRFRASIGGSIASAKGATPPGNALPPRSELRWNSTRTPPLPTTKTGGTVKLSDMKNALPVTPLAPRKLTGGDVPLLGRRKPTEDVTQVTQMMESLELGSVTRLRKPSVTAPAATGKGSYSPEPSSLQRNNPWRRSLNLSTAVTSPPPPPPRKNFATLPRNAHGNGSGNNNTASPPAPSTANAPAAAQILASSSGVNSGNNNNNNNPSKLPVPAFKRRSYLGSNF